MLGGLELRCGDVALTRLASRPVTVLLARLALRPERRHSREQLAELLWPNAPPAVGRNRFRATLAMLRRALEPPGWTPGSVLFADRLTVQLKPGVVVCDAVEFERHARAGHVASARSAYGGELLPGLYDDWVVEERQRLQSLFESVGDGAAACGPACAPSPAPAGLAPSPGPSLPAGIGSFFGRQAEVADLGAAVAGHRLVTLTGVGGAGKTRLAVEVARRAWAAGTAARVAFVALAECDAAQEIVERVRAALQLPDNGAKDAAKVLDQVAAALDGAASLLVLDNYEQLVEQGGVEVVETLLERLPLLRLLVTSRRALCMPAECEVVLAPLALPDPASSLEDSARNPGVALFVERARDVRRDFQLGARNVAEVVAICRVLEGLPLAIELAAAKVRAWSLADMRQALATRRGEVLRRSAPARAVHRHASLHAAIDWSWRLLTERQQRFAMALTVFRGGWTVEAAQAVAMLPDARALTESLIVDSLVQARADADGGLHFGMLETVREFAREQLPPAQAAMLRERHRAWCLGVARAALARQDLVDEVVHANVLSAIASALEDERPDEAVQLALALQMQWVSLGTAPHVRELLRRLAAELPPATAGLPAFLCALARLLIQAGESAEAKRLADRAASLAGAQALARADALCTQARVDWTLTRDHALVEPSLREAMRLADGSGAHQTLALGERMLAVLAFAANDLPTADRHYARSVDHHLADNDRRGALVARQGRVRCLVEGGQLAPAIDMALAALEEARQLRHIEAELLYLDQLGVAYANMRRRAEALAVYRRQTLLAREQHKVYMISYGLWNQAMLLARLREPALAAAMMAFSQRYWELHFAPLQPDERRHVDKVCRLVAVQIGAPACRLHWERGMTMTLAEGLDLGSHGERDGRPSLA